jgi:hypothetical protein
MYPVPEIDARFAYVRSCDGDYAVQVVHENGHFIILTDDQAFTRGFGWASSWKTVPAQGIPKGVRRELRHALANYVDYVLTCE